MTNNDRLWRADLAISGTIGLVGLFVIGATFATPLRLDWRSFLAPVSCGVVIAAVLLAVICGIAAARFFGADVTTTDDLTAASNSRAGEAGTGPSIAQA